MSFPSGVAKWSYVGSTIRVDESRPAASLVGINHADMRYLETVERGAVHIRSRRAQISNILVEILPLLVVGARLRE